jgi:hypothetical protein
LEVHPSVAENSEMLDGIMFGFVYMQSLAEYNQTVSNTTVANATAASTVAAVV